jgi:hypothetical protein
MIPAESGTEGAIAVNLKRRLIMVTSNKKRAGGKKRKVKVSKLEKVNELSAADKKGIRGGDKKPVPPPMTSSIVNKFDESAQKVIQKLAS